MMPIPENFCRQLQLNVAVEAIATSHTSKSVRSTASTLLAQLDPQAVVSVKEEVVEKPRPVPPQTAAAAPKVEELLAEDQALAEKYEQALQVRSSPPAPFCLWPYVLLKCFLL